MRILKLVFVLILIFLLKFSATRIVKMAQTRGWIPGPDPQTKIIANKKIEDNYREGYWVSWGEEDIETPGPHRINLIGKSVDRYSVGDTIEIIYFGSSEWPYHKNGKFASSANLVFDGIILILWCVALVLIVWSEIDDMIKKQDQSPLQPPTEDDQDAAAD